MWSVIVPQVFGFLLNRDFLRFSSVLKATPFSSTENRGFVKAFSKQIFSKTPAYRLRADVFEYVDAVDQVQSTLVLVVGREISKAHRQLKRYLGFSIQALSPKVS